MTHWSFRAGGLLAALALALTVPASAQGAHPLNAAAHAAAQAESPAQTQARSAAYAARPAMSATVDDDIFLQGTFISLGISGSGSFGTANVAPAGFARSPRQLGYIFDEDGFGMGDPASTGDFFLPGSPVEGFSVGYRATEGGLTSVFTNEERSGFTQVTPTSVADLSVGDQLAAQFIGVTADDVLQVTQTVSYDDDDRRVAVVITLTNVGPDEIFDVRYLRNVDPDQDLETFGTFTTNQTLIANFPGDARAVVQAVGPSSGVPFLYVSTDGRLRVAYGGFGNRDPYEDFLYDNPPATGSTNTNDEAVSITADVGSLLPGESKTFQFFLGFDDDIATDPLLTLSATPLSIPEGSASTITATIAEPSDEDVVVTLAFSGTATGPDATGDYTAPMTITIPSGATSASVTLTSILDADFSEGDETVVVDVDNATNAIEQGEQRVTITITPAAAPLEGCTPSSSLFFSDWDTDATPGPGSPRGEFAEVTNDAGDGTGYDLSGCDFLVFDPFTENVTYAADAAGVVTDGGTYEFANVPTGNGQALPVNTFPDAPSVFALVDGDASAGQSVGTVLANADVVAAVVLDRDGTLFGSARGGASMTSAETAAALYEALSRLYAVADEGDGALGLDVTTAPNPASGRTTITFGLAEAGDASVTVYDALGRQVAVVADGPYAAGRHDVTLDASALPTGVYVVRVAGAGTARSAQLTVVR